MRKYIYIAVFTLLGQIALAQPQVHYRGKMSKIGKEHRVEAVSFDSSTPIKLLLPHKQ